MVNKMKIKFYGLEPLSLVDLDGMLTCTLFCSLCNFRCPFCHNKNLVYSTNLEEIPFNEILDYLKLRRNVINAVCLTGGEATLYDDLERVLRPIKELGYFIKLDTNGTNPQMIKYLYEKHLIDYCAMDIKNTEEKYPITIGNIVCNMDNIKESINYLKSSGIGYEFRTTIVKEYHQLDDILKIVKDLGIVDKYYLQKFVDHGTCIKPNLHPIDESSAQMILNEARKIMPNVFLRGY